MDFHYTEEQRALRELSGRLLAQRFTDEHRKLFRRGADAYDATLWAALAEAGVLGTAIAPAQGGSGLGLTELCLVLEEQGRTLAALPLLATPGAGRAAAAGVRQLGPARAVAQEVADGRLLLTRGTRGGRRQMPCEPSDQARRDRGRLAARGREDLRAVRAAGAVTCWSRRAAKRTARGSSWCRRCRPGLHAEPQRSTPAASRRAS